MKTKGEALALLGESLTACAVWWIFSVTLAMKNAKEPFAEMVWTLLMAAGTYIVYQIFLRRPRSVPAIAAVSGILLALQIWLYTLLYKGSVSFGFILTILLLSAVAVYTTLYLCLKKPVIVKHLTYLDLMILALVWMSLFLRVIRISVFSEICAVGVILLDIGGLIALRMNEDGESPGIGRAFALASGSAAALSILIFVLVKIFSRSGRFTGAFLDGIKKAVLTILGWIDTFVAWLASHFHPEAAGEAPEMVPMPGGMSEEELIEEVSINPVPIVAAIGVIILVAVIFILFRLRRSRAGFGTVSVGGTSVAGIRRRKKKTGGLFSKLRERLTFLKNSFLYRNTPRGVLVWLENRAKKSKTPRSTGESVREFVFRLMPGGELAVLADDLDGMFYGGKTPALSAADCKDLKKTYRNRTRQ